MRQISLIVVSIFLVIASGAQCTDNASYWQTSLPLSVATAMGDSSKPRLEFGSGAGADIWLWSYDNWIFGPGGGLYATLPFQTGNAAVRVSPYSVYGEGRLSAGYRLEGAFVSIIPFLALKSEMGLAIYHRQVLKSSSQNTDFMFSLGPALGSAYWFDNWGFLLSYGATFGTKGARQQLDICLALRLPV